jgi:predicted membrane protein
MDKHFNKIFWFIVGLTAFGAFLTIYMMAIFKGDAAERYADQFMIFWLSTAVGGGIGYLIGSSAQKQPLKAPIEGTTTADISATITTDTTKKEDVPNTEKSIE